MLTFDIWDTVLTRMVGTPQDVFLFVADAADRAGLLRCAPATFPRLRLAAEADRIRKAGPRVCLADIYAELSWWGAILEGGEAAACRAELGVERRLCRAVPGARARVRVARERHGRVGFISEMYMPEDFLIALLEDFGIWEPGDEVVTSAAAGCSKRGGALYTAAARRLSVPASAITHLGNDQCLDVEGARSAGATAVLLPLGNPNRFERLLSQHASSTGGTSSLFAGASRIARLSREDGGPFGDDPSRCAALTAVAAGVVAPVVAAFALWVLAKAKSLGIRSLYFLSRDGQIILRACQAIERVARTGVRMRYLYAGRRAWGPGEQRDPARRYLLGEGLRGASDWGIVDVGWHGNMQESLGQIMGSLAKPPVGLYFGILPAAVSCTYGTRHAFLYDAPSDRGNPTPLAAEELVAFLEMFCCGDEGGLAGYSAESPPRPILNTPRNGPAIEWGLPAVRAVLDRFTRELVAVIRDYPALAEADMRDVAAELISEAWMNPTGPEGEFWGSFPFEYGAEGVAVRALAPPLRLGRLLRYGAGAHPSCLGTWWPAGSVARSDHFLRIAFRLARLARACTCRVRKKKALD